MLLTKTAGTTTGDVHVDGIITSFGTLIHSTVYGAGVVTDGTTTTVWVTVNE